MTTLSLAVLALLLPPLVVGGFARRPALASALDGIVLAVIVSLVALEIAPDAVRTGGPWAVAGLLLGLFGPGAAERAGFTGAHVHRIGFAVGSLALLAHAAMDGVALATVHAPTDPLALAVILHQLPVGAAAWASARSRFGVALAWGTLVLLAAATVAGFAAGQTVLGVSGGAGFAILTGLAGGTLLHVVTHEPLHGARADATLLQGGRTAVNAGGTGALVALLAIGAATTLRGAHDDHVGIARALLELTGRVGVPVLLAAWLGRRAAHPVRVLAVALAAATLGWAPALALATALTAATLVGTGVPRDAVPGAGGHVLAGLVAGALLTGLLPDLGGTAGSIVAALALVQLPLPPIVTALATAALALRGMDPASATVVLGMVAGLPGGVRAHARGPRGTVVRSLLSGVLPALAAGAAVHVAPRWLPIVAPPDSALLSWLGVGGVALLLARELLHEGPRAWLAASAALEDAHDHDHDHAPTPESP